MERPAQRRVSRALALGAVALALLTASDAEGQPAPDSAAVEVPVVAPVTVPDPPDAVRPRTPRGAVLRALAVPGWGQVYNRQPVKAPFAAAAVVGAAAFAVDRQQQYLLYRRAAFFAGCVEEPDRPDICTDEALAAARDEYEALGQASAGRLQDVRDRARGQRDVAVLLIGVAYAFQALDAYVAAELAGFDVSEDLSLHVAPQPDGTALALRLRL